MSITLETPTTDNFNWQEVIAKYQIPDMSRSLWQLINTTIPLIAMFFLMAKSLALPYWVTLLLAIPTGGLVIRLFIIQHDCGHGAFFKSQRTSEIVGSIIGVFTFTPYHDWRHHHAVHHATSGDLGRRGVGDVWTLTVEEFRALSRRKQIEYRIYRNPLFLFVIAPTLYFGILNRFVTDPTTRMRERKSVYGTNIGILLVALVWSLFVGLKGYLMIQIPVTFVASSLGVWLFYVQHQFEGTYWEQNEEWDYVTAALMGSSFYKLPKILQWFTGNIGFHHIHHLSPRVANYYLEECHNNNPRFQQIEPITMLSSVKSIHYRLWDEENKRLVGFDAAR